MPLAMAASSWSSARVYSLDINVLMVVAVIGAVALGEWFEAAAVVWLFGLAQELEWFSLERARNAIRSLMAVAPAVARVRRDGQLREVPVADVRIGDVLLVKPGERMPVDGVIVDGESAFDESPVTGESWPVEKAPGDDVFAGTINGTGSIDVAARRLASDSTIARIIHLVEHAQRQRAHGRVERADAVEAGQERDGPGISPGDGGLAFGDAKAHVAEGILHPGILAAQDDLRPLERLPPTVPRVVRPPAAVRLLRRQQVPLDLGSDGAEPCARVLGEVPNDAQDDVLLSLPQRGEHDHLTPALPGEEGDVALLQEPVEHPGCRKPLHPDRIVDNRSRPMEGDT